MLKCKIQDKILDYDFMLDSYKILDEEQLNGTIEVLSNNGFFYLGCGTFIDNETHINRFHFFKRQFGTGGRGITIFNLEDIYNSDIGCKTQLERAVLKPMASCSLASISDSLYELENLSHHKWSNELLRLEDDFESIPQRTPPGRTPKQHKLIMSFNKQGKKGKKWKK